MTNWFFTSLSAKKLPEGAPANNIILIEMTYQRRGAILKEPSCPLTLWPLMATVSRSSQRKCGSVASWSMEMLIGSEDSDGSEDSMAFSAVTLQEGEGEKFVNSMRIRV